MMGWAPVGERWYDQKKGIRKTRYNITAALNQNQLFAPLIFEGYCNAAVYKTYLEQVLIPTLRPGMVLISDNARFHKSRKIISDGRYKNTYANNMRTPVAIPFPLLN